jgi:hypothetical protein
MHTHMHIIPRFSTMFVCQPACLTRQHMARPENINLRVLRGIKNTRGIIYFHKMWREDVLSASIVLQLVSSGVMYGTDSPSEDSVRFMKPIW